MVGISGDMIGQDALPESLVARCLDVLRTLSPNERDLIRVVVEVVHELRDTSDPEEDITVSVFFLSFFSLLL
jgi:condensin complex subunit 3